MIITKIIAEYLQSNRRITIPALGTFLSKGDASPLLFSEFMKSDDGVLRELLCLKGGVSELEAAIIIDRFVFELRHAMESDERYTMPHLGYMHSEDGRSYIFTYDQSAQLSQSTQEEPIDVTEEPVMADVTPAADVDSTDATTAEQTTTQQAAPIDERRRFIEDLYTHSDTISANEETAPADEQEVPSVARRSRTDIWMICGIIATLFAIFAILYGIIVEWSVGNISFGEPIDTYLEYFIDGQLWESIHGILSPDVNIATPNPADIIPQDTIYI